MLLNSLIRSTLSFKKNLFIFVTIVNGIFLIVFSEHSLLAYRNSSVFYMLILYLVVLLNMFIRSKSFWWSIKVNFIFSFSICIPVFPYLALLLQVKIQVLYRVRMKRVSTSVSFLTLEEVFSVLHHLR
jgi:hypothetical protein